VGRRKSTAAHVTVIEGTSLVPVLIAILALPMVEIALFILVGGWIGLWPTLALVVLAAVAGGMILRRPRLTRAQLRPVPGGNLLSGVMPVAEEAARMLAGLLLIAPGFLSDAVAILLLIPPLRRALIAALGRRMVGTGPVPRTHETVIEGEFVDLDDPQPVTRRPPLTRH
jgi:UPF0716 protein FxsA